MEGESEKVPKVSIIMPVYNGEKYLEEAIQSILLQTFQDWELWLVNDCSTDSSLKIMEKYAGENDKIQIITNSENYQLPRSLNIGFRHARGTYLTWTSDDNFYQPDAVEVMVRELENHPDCGLVCCDVDYLFEDGAVMAHRFPDASQLYLENVVGACFLYRREVLETVGEYDPAMFLVEDYDYWLRISQKYPVVHIPRCLYQYRFHKQSLTTQKRQTVAKQLYRLRLRELEYLLSKATADDRAALFLDMWFCGGEDLWRHQGQFFPDGLLPKELQWLKRVSREPRQPDPDRKLILFGAGFYGKEAVKYFGKERVQYFVDNNSALHGTMKEDVRVISFEELKEVHESYEIVISASSQITIALAQQLEASGIKRYLLFLNIFYNTPA
nr:glycosyltransferase [uncultured Oscillibacter sp.]